MMPKLTFKYRQFLDGSFGVSLRLDGEPIEGFRAEGLGNTREEAEFALYCTFLVAKERMSAVTC